MTPGQVGEEWTKSPTAKFLVGRFLFSLTVVGNKLVAAGGSVSYSRDFTSSVEIMPSGKETFEKQKWKLKNSMSSHCAVATSSDELVIIGGETKNTFGSAVTLNKVTKYNITDGANTDLLNLPVPVLDHACALFENKITISGGNKKYGSPYNKEVWQLDKGTWSKLPSMPEGRLGHAMMVVDGKLYVFGGLTGNNDVPVKNIIELDLEKKAWIEVKKLAENFAYGGSVLIEN